VVTSPPYFGLRDYGIAGQIGLEPTPEGYVAAIVDVFREVRRVLRDDGTCWLNLGDSYASSGAIDHREDNTTGRGGMIPRSEKRTAPTPPGLKPKDLIGIPWRVAFALQADGWYLRSDIIWHKPNPMPESVRDRPTKSHEYVFLLAKNERYYYDAGAIRERYSEKTNVTYPQPDKAARAGITRNGTGKSTLRFQELSGRNRRSVWTVCPKPFKGAHFATMPLKLAATCIKAGCPKGGIVFDPFVGAGSTILAANALGRRGIGCDLSPAYLAMARRRIDRPHAPVPRPKPDESPGPLFAHLAGDPGVYA
jgi:DNA modification methylase